MPVEIKRPVDIDIELIHPNEWNPNKQSEETFNMLVREVEEDGFDHPINLVPCGCTLIDKPHYKIIGGEHRWRTMLVHGNKVIPAFIHEEWTEVEQKLKTVRRNLMSGDIDSQKFTALVKGLEGKVDPISLPGLMGFTDNTEFEKFLLKDSGKKDKSFLDGLMEETKKEKFAVDSLADIVANIFGECAGTIDQNYLFFTYKGSIQTAILCDKPALDSVQQMIAHLKDKGGTATSFITEAINVYLGKK